MSLDKKIQDTFNPPPSLEGEDWLMPSDDVFDAIEGAIYPDENPRKRILPFWFWLIPFLLIVGGVLFLSNVDKEDDLLTNNFEGHTSEVTLKEELYSTEISEEVGVSEQGEISNEYVYSVASVENVSVNAEITNQKDTRLTGSDFTLNQNENIVSSNAIVGFDFKSLSDKFTGDVASAESRTLSSVLSTRDSYSEIHKFINQTLFVTRSDDWITPPSKVNTITALSVNQNDWFVKFSAGMSRWNFNLNNNYLVALQPADFSHTDGSGYYFEFSIEKNISSRVSVGLSASFDRDQFESGHNSVINYDLSTEDNDQTKDFALSMASPLGFLESNIVVARNVDASNNTNLIVDLDNKHTAINFDLGLYADVRLFDYGNFSLSSQIGGGMNYLSHVSNTLDRFNTSEAGFDSQSSRIISDQSDLRRVRSYFNIGLNLGYDWSSNTSVGLSYQFRRDINSVYESGDFSTLIQRQMSGIYIKRRI